MTSHCEGNLKIWLNLSKRDKPLENTVRSMPFTLSCDPDGNLDGADARNCLERGGYRLVRVGMGSIIAHIGQDGASTVVYRSGTDNDTFGSALSRAAWSIRRNER